MAEVALSVTASPPAALPTGGNGDSATSAKASGPFAVLLASATGEKTSGGVPPIKVAADPDAIMPGQATAVPTPAISKISSSPASGILGVVDAAPATLPAVPVESSSNDTDASTPAAKKKDGKADDSDDGDPVKDPLADAIASGATAVLAFAPVIVAPVPTPTPAATSTKVDPLIMKATPAAGPIAAAETPKTAAGTSDSPRPGDFDAVSPLPTRTDAQSADLARPANTTAPDRDTPSGQSNSDGPPRQPSSEEAKSPATAMTPGIAKAVITAIQTANATAASGDPTKVAAPFVPPANTSGQPSALSLPSSVPSQQAQQSAVPVETASRRRGSEIAAPRRGGEPRKRADIAAFDSASIGLNQRAADIRPDAAKNPVTATTEIKGDAMVDQALTIGRDGAWLDKLAHEIAGTAGNGGDLQFKLNPQHLGSLKVAIRQSDDGASIRMTADNDATRNILLDAQPRLMAEARAQGLKVSESHVDLNQNQNSSPNQNRNENQGANQDASRWAQGSAGQNGAAQNGQNRQSSPGHQPFVSNLGRKADAESESSNGDSDARYA